MRRVSRLGMRGRKRINELLILVALSFGVAACGKEETVVADIATDSSFYMAEGYAISAGAGRVIEEIVAEDGTDGQYDLHSAEGVGGGNTEVEVVELELGSGTFALAEDTVAVTTENEDSMEGGERSEEASEGEIQEAEREMTEGEDAGAIGEDNGEEQATENNGSMEQEEAAQVLSTDTEETEQAETAEVEEAEQTDPYSWVPGLTVAEVATELFIVEVADPSSIYATVSFHQKTAAGDWQLVFATDAFIGRKGLGKTVAGDEKTPIGIYRITDLFGRRADPGCLLPYIKVDDSYYWVADPESVHYNELVTTHEVGVDWGEAEHISACGAAYNYVAAIDYNRDPKIPGAGSAIFIHCSRNKGTGGCIAIPEDKMVQFLRMLDSGCVVVIDTCENVRGY